MAGIEKDRDWDKEMAEVDRLLKKLPLADPTLGRGRGGEPTAQRPAVPAGGGTPTSRAVAPGGGGQLGAWVKVGLGVLVGIGIAPGVWPYTHGCGLRLIFYLLGVSTVIATGLWASVASWRRRLGFAHVVSQILIIWGVLLLTREVLPRVGPTAAALWLCPDVVPK
ncbi:MAG: hypothetical protein AUH78_27050 [Gemmatimonadetes bacterium 13_1_40CM_4_69_8]|nr:MAG: hypothetical protein AUH45_01710 [Gemmatimonadetes bacterium 13_1_40CM_69_22]OLC67882.1 MAG: hypothetical protein AUH78_27050 [Gemmatimonadetes bacterium 13_1_40CM_4_69_8]